ncbi:diaminopimelate decarboxylase [Streptomyces xanthochromogenes]|uniref:diaminopimelate decarboxylase n=1 Tax=Streptomyces xanthochromogenes TaxID=67384 RepID=UPI0034131A93
MTSQATPSAAKAAAAERRDQAVRAAVEQGLAGPDAPIVALLDTTGIRTGAAALRAAFAAVTDAPVLHAFAVKACPLVPVLRLLRAEGLGAEVASPGELALARAAGMTAADTVLDSPAKTPAELREALALGIAVNADNPQELARIDAFMTSAPSASPVGLRVNPQLGAGSIDALSTATATSKFGVKVAYELAEEINAAAGRRQVDTIDIGGGLPVNFGSDEETPTYASYARLLKEEVPGLFDGRYGLVTEFGRSLLAKHGTVLARVEYAKSSGGRPIAVTHAGVQIAARTVYAPASWPLRIAAYDAKGRPKTGPSVAQDIAGPACFAGDLLAENRPLPLLEQGDYTGVLDTGAYYFAHHYSYNSLAKPGVYGFTATAEGVRFATVRDPQPIEDLVAEAGGAHTDGLL